MTGLRHSALLGVALLALGSLLVSAQTTTTYGTCSAQGQSGVCKSVSTCASGNNVAGLCPGDRTIQCCLPKPLDYGKCLTSAGFIGTCLSGACTGTTSDEDVCPGNTKCCVTSTAVPPPPPARDYGSCYSAAQGKTGTCKSVSSCATTPIAGLCPGDNTIQCCPDGAALAAPVYAPAQRAGFYGACQTAAGTAGSCIATGSCAGTKSDGQCPASAPAGTTCCDDGGSSYINGVDLPGGRGVHSPTGAALAPSVLTCLKGTSPANAQANWLAVRGWNARCQVEPTVVDSLAAAATAGLAADVILEPAAWCGLSARAQSTALLATLKSSTYGRVWVSVQAGAGWGASQAANLAWVDEATQVLAGAIGPARVGVFTSAAAWGSITGASASSAAAQRVGAFPLWYVGSTAVANFADFSAFGAWTYPTLKQYPFAPNSQVCGTALQLNWQPTRSTTPAAAAAAPPAEALGAACTYNGNSGTCQSLTSCTGSVALGVCADASKACCLPATLTRPTPAAKADVPMSYGMCVGGAAKAVGVCMASRNCASTDTQYTDASCVGDTSTGEGAEAGPFACCVPASGFEMPPSTDNPADKPAYTPEKGARAGDDIPLKARSSKAGATTPVSKWSGPPAPPAVCVNKAGLETIEYFEGFYANFYLDAVGIRTIGFGTACHSYPCDTLRAPLTRAQAERVMLADLNANYAPCVRKYIKVPLNSNQFSALTSFVYNVGCGGLRGSLAAQLNSGCYNCVKAKLMEWTKADGRVLEGLRRRRAAEGELFNSGKPSPCLDDSGSVGDSEGQSWGACTYQRQKGTCQSVSSCEGTTVSGLCDGPNDIKCCLDGPPNPPPPPPTRCGNGGTCKLTSTCNTASNVVKYGLCPGDADNTCCQPKSASMADGWWEGATRDVLSGSGGTMDTSFKPRIVLHTTEGSTYEGARATYSRTEPHFTVTFQRGMFQAYQHISIRRAGMALYHPAGTIHTNNANCVQIEIVGQAQKVKQLPARYLDGIAALLKWIMAALNIPAKAANFLPYPESYGDSPVRMSDSQWRAFSGVAGHQHVPYNDHGDPGAININYLMSATGAIWPPVDPAASVSEPVDYGTCSKDGRKGMCGEKSDCKGTVVTGLCDGPSNIACCMENYGACTVPASTAFPAVRQGICQESSTCKGSTVPGLCPGPDSVSCCVPDYGTCVSGSQSGKCQPTKSCTGTVVSGLCAGPADIACCLPAAKPANFGTCQVAYEVDGGIGKMSSVTGQCIPKASCASPAVATPGKCPNAPADVACCHQPAPPRKYANCGVNGNCMDVSGCTGTIKRGLCPGPSNIACCEYPLRKAAATAAPLNTPKTLFGVQTTTPATGSEGPTTTETLPSTFTLKELTLCTAGGLQGFCLNSTAAGNSVCNGVLTFPSSCDGGGACCTPSSCHLTNTTSGICIAPSDCRAQAGYVTPGYCGGESGVDGSTSCCTGAGVSQCDTPGLLACLLADGDATTCAASFNCPPNADYSTMMTADVQSAPSAGKQAHSNYDLPPEDVPQDSQPTRLDDEGAAAGSQIQLLLLLAAAVLAMLAANVQ